MSETPDRSAVVDLKTYRAARRDSGQLPLFPDGVPRDPIGRHRALEPHAARPLSERDVKHRQRMLRFLSAAR